MARCLVAIWLLLAVPGVLAGQADSAAPRLLLHFRTRPLVLREPAVFREAWSGGPRITPAQAVAAWDSSLTVALDSTRTARAVSARLLSIYGRRAVARETVAEAKAEQRGLFGLSTKYADLAIDGQASLDIRTERLRNERCSPALLLDVSSGCRGGFSTPRFENEFSLQAGGLLGRRLHVMADFDTQRDYTARNNVQVYYEGLEDEIVRRVEVGSVTFRPPSSRFLTAAIPANNFGVNASFEFGALQLQTIAATQKGSVVAERAYTVGQTTSQPQDRQVRDLDFEAGRFFWVVDPAGLAGFPAIDILNFGSSGLSPSQQPAQVRVYRYRPASLHSGTNPNLGGITAIAIGADTTQRATAQWELLLQGNDYYLDPSGLWFTLVGKLDRNDFLAVSYTTTAGTTVGTFPAQDRPPAPGAAPLDTLRLIIQPNVAATFPTFRHEMRQIYRVAGNDLDRASLKVSLTVNRSEAPGKGGATYLSQLGLAIPTDPTGFDVENRLFPRTRDPGADQTIHEAYLVFPHLLPFDDSTRLTTQEVSDSLYRTPLYLLFSNGPSAKFIFRLRYNSTGSGDRSTLNLNALEIRQGSEQLVVGGRVLERGLDYSISYEVGQVTFLNPDQLFGVGASQVTARFEERGLFSVAPTSIFGLASRYSLGDRGAVNLVGIYQREQTAFNRPPLGFEASANLVGGVSSELHFKPNVVTQFLNHLTSAPTTAPSRLDLNGEFALTKPDPNRSGQAFLEEFEGDAGIRVLLREGAWEVGSRPQRADSVETVLGGPQFDPADAVALTWQNLVPTANGSALELRAPDIDPNIRLAGAANQLETVMYLTLHADTAGGIVQRNNRSRWSLPRRDFAPRWRSIVTPLSSTGLDLSKNEFLEFWVFQSGDRTADSADLRLVFDLGTVNEDALALAPESLTVTAGDSVFTGRRYVGLGRLDTEREPTGVFNAVDDDIGILGDRPDTVFFDGEPRRRPALCQQQLTTTVPVFPWGDLTSRCSNGNGLLDAEDLDGDNVLNLLGPSDNGFRWVVRVRDLSRFFVRNGVRTADSLGGWRLYRLPLRQPDVTLGTPNIRLVQHLRITVAAPTDNGQPDIVSRFALARMRFLGSPWVRRSETPIAGIAGALGKPTGEVVASLISTENTELGYTSPPGVLSGTERKGGSQSELGTQINEQSLRVIGRGLQVGDRAEAYVRFPAGPQSLLKYRQLRIWARGRGTGWEEGDFKVFVKVGSDNQDFYQYLTASKTTTWEPEIAIDLETWRRLRAQVETRYLTGLPADSAARVACGGDTVSTAFVACDGPYLVYVGAPGINPPNLASVQELSAGIFRAAATTSVTDGEVWVDDIRLTQPESRLGTAVAFDARLTASDVADFSLSYVRRDGQFQQIGQNPSFQTTGALQISTTWRMDRFLPTSLGLSVPLAVTFGRTTVDPQLLTGSDLRGSALQDLRRPSSSAASYAITLRRSQRGKRWLTRGFIDPLTLSASLATSSGQTELSKSSSNASSYQAVYSLVLTRWGPRLGLGGLVGWLPRFLRESAGAKGLQNPLLNLAPSNVRWSSGLTRTEADLTSFPVPVERAQDTLIRPIASLIHLWRNSGGLTWQPLGMLSLTGDLTSTRDLRRYPDSTSLGRVAGQSRRSLLGLDVGVERDRALTTAIGLTPRLTSWLRPRYLTNSGFLLSRSLTSRTPIRADGDTAGAFVLPQTLNNSRSREYGAAADFGRGLSALFGDSTKMGKVSRSLRPLDLSNRLLRTSTFDRAAFDPSASYQLALGGRNRFLSQEGQRALGFTETRTTTLGSGVNLSAGLSANLSYSLVKTLRLQRVGDGFFESDSRQREWPAGDVRLSRTFGRGPIAFFRTGASYRRREGSTDTPSLSGPAAHQATISTSLAPDAQLGLRNGMAISFGYSSNDQRTETSGNTTRGTQDSYTASLTHAFRLPRAFGRHRPTLRSSLTGLTSKAATCLEINNQPGCFTVSDIRRKELRGGLDADVTKIMTGGLQFGYSLNDVRNLSTRVSQIFIAARFQLSLYAGDYR